MSSREEDAFLAELDALLAVEPAPAPKPVINQKITLVSPPPPPPAPVRDAEPAPPVSAAPLRRPIVLIVDDNKDYRDVVRYILTEHGYEVREAVDGEQGVRLAVDAPPDIVLLDFNMPGMNGYEVIQALRGCYETRKVPIILFTGAGNRDQLKRMALDISAFLDKPISNGNLLKAVRQVAESIGRAPVPDGSAQTAAQPDAPSAAGAAMDKAPAPAPAEPPAPAAKPADAGPSLESLESLANWQKGDELLVAIEKEKDGPEEELKLDGLGDDSPLVARVNQILARAVEIGASDIHIEPQEAGIVVRVRRNGSLEQLCTLPSAVGSRLSARIKIMSELVITERRRPQDGQFRATIRGKKVEFRVSTLPSTLGEKIVMRVLGGSKLKSGVTELGVCERDHKVIEKALMTPHGLILVTGPTGSGKTTTLYSMIASVNRPDVNVMTAEDPVEYRLPGITQVHVKPAVGLTFEAALRSFLRQDPDIMLIGEIRDLETAETAVKASITGHLVLSTLHTNSAPATITRLTHMGLAPFLVAASVKMIVAQRLVKTLCPSCKLEMPLADAEHFLKDEEAARLPKVWRPVGCAQCEQTGYAGRMPIFEVMPVASPQMREAIINKASVDELYALAAKEGMTSLRGSALQAVAEGKTSLAEALKIVVAE